MSRLRSRLFCLPLDAPSCLRPVRVKNKVCTWRRVAFQRVPGASLSLFLRASFTEEQGFCQCFALARPSRHTRKRPENSEMEHRRGGFDALVDAYFDTVSLA